MHVEKPYIRENAVTYARKFAFSQNPLFANFAGIGGNCTNFVSQSIYAGSCEMNYTPTYGWYFISLDERSPSWTGVDYFYNFITKNKGVGPYGTEVGIDELELGDVIQLGREGEGYYHTLLVVGFEGDDVLVAAQTDNAYGRPLSTYTNDYARFIKILGVRFEMPDNYACYEKILNPEGDGTSPEAS
ncbi:MAG: amidase domain-containing protein [Clostridia bacterium]|nr:amidase domain-containing protein [Clostridia bacterium]